jgi:hypothetical protein
MALPICVKSEVKELLSLWYHRCRIKTAAASIGSGYTVESGDTQFP